MKEYFEKIEKVRKDLHLVKPKKNDALVFDVGLDNIDKNIEAFERFVKMYNLVEIKDFDSLFLKKRFKKLGDVGKFFKGDKLFDHMRLAKADDGNYFLILQPYYNRDECVAALNKFFPEGRYDILGKQSSYHSNGNTNLVVVYEDKMVG